MTLAFEGKHLKVTVGQHIKLALAFRHCLPICEHFEVMDAWIDANPRKRPKNQYRFMVNWLQKQPKPMQDVKQGILQTKEPVKVKAKILEKYKSSEQLAKDFIGGANEPEIQEYEVDSITDKYRTKEEFE